MEKAKKKSFNSTFFVRSINARQNFFSLTEIQSSSGSFSPRLSSSGPMSHNSIPSRSSSPRPGSVATALVSYAPHEVRMTKGGEGHWGFEVGANVFVHFFHCRVRSVVHD